MSVNVDQIGEALLVEHYVGDVTDTLHRTMVSTSDLFTGDGRSKIQVIRELTAEPMVTVSSSPTR
ncbi:hypothetical protein [Streptomyces sp. NBC_01497]|uniref:hypothetical protein n=1 Tax=Streptomyces sp. NBC_01497 TaxID=2903885 RepID=UPI002E356737|nr:hypothetical protein [Streptomyces sp. NBC_01497]